jgi:GNAT superfamily N-acetyltransferase
MARQWTRGDYVLSDDSARLDLPWVHAYLAEKSYWARNIPMAILEKAVRNSVCYGIYRNGGQVAFARVVTDKATFGYLCDVFVDEAARGRGLAQWMVECILKEPEFAELRNWTLYTRDAHGLYARFGFAPPEDPASVMRIRKPNPYG